MFRPGPERTAGHGVIQPLQAIGPRRVVDSPAGSQALECREVGTAHCIYRGVDMDAVDDGATQCLADSDIAAE